MCRSIFSRSRALRAARNPSKSTFAGLTVALEVSAALTATLVAVRSGMGCTSFLAIFGSVRLLVEWRSITISRSGTVCGLLQRGDKERTEQERARHVSPENQL